MIDNLIEMHDFTGKKKKSYLSPFTVGNLIYYTSDAYLQMRRVICFPFFFILVLDVGRRSNNTVGMANT